MKEAPWYFPAKNSGKLSPVQGLEGHSHWQGEGKRERSKPMEIPGGSFRPGAFWFFLACQKEH